MAALAVFRAGDPAVAPPGTLPRDRGAPRSRVDLSHLASNGLRESCEVGAADEDPHQKQLERNGTGVTPQA